MNEIYDSILFLYCFYHGAIRQEVEFQKTEYGRT
jgi:hypothetical protein